MSYTRGRGFMPVLTCAPFIRYFAWLEREFGGRSCHASTGFESFLVGSSPG
jgi:hypothetical protein